MAYEININDDDKFKISNSSVDGIETIELDGNVLINHNLTVLGAQTIIESTTVSVEDRIMTLGVGNSSTALDMGLLFERAGTNTAMLWRESENIFAFAEVPENAIDSNVSLTITNFSEVEHGNLYLRNINNNASMFLNTEQFGVTNKNNAEFGWMHNVVPGTAAIDKYFANAAAVRMETFNDSFKVRTAPPGLAGADIAYSQEFTISEDSFTFRKKGDPTHYDILTGNSSYIGDINGLVQNEINAGSNNRDIDLHLYNLLDVEGDHVPEGRLTGKFLKFSVGKWAPDWMHTINEIRDVDTTTVAPVDGSVLQWDSNTAKWAPGAGIMLEHLWEMQDVDMASETDATTNQILKFNGVNWSPSSISNINEITNVSASPSAQHNGRPLVWDQVSNTWIIGTVGQVSFLGDLLDVDTTTVSSNKFLKFSATSNEWLPGNINILEEVGNVDVLSGIGANATQTGSFLKWDDTQTKWIAGFIEDLSDILNVDVAPTPLDHNHALVWDQPSSSWVIGGTGIVDVLHDLADVTLSAPADKEFLKYDSSTAKWRNGAIDVLEEIGDVDYPFSPLQSMILKFNGTTGKWQPNIISTLGEIGDVYMVGIQDGQILQWSATAGRFEPSLSTPATTLNDLSDVTVLAPSPGQILTFDGSKWVPATRTWVTTVNSLTDTTINAPADGQVLTYNTTTTRWENQDNTHVNRLSSLVGDVLIPNPSEEDILQYVSGKWIHRPYTIATISDTVITTPVEGQVLTYESGQWVNSNSDRTRALSLLTDDVDISATPAENQVLQYVSGKWTASTPLWASTVNSLLDTSITAPTNGEILTFDNGTWKNQPNLHTVNTIANSGDVELVTLNDNDVLTWDSASGKWENQPNHHTTTIIDSTDVFLAGLLDGDVLTWNGTLSKWQNKPANHIDTIAALTGDVEITAPAHLDLLQYDNVSAKWKNGPISATFNLPDLLDVSVFLPETDHVLTYNTTTLRWENKPATIPTVESIANVELTGLAHLDILHYDLGTGTWKNGPPPATFSLGDLINVWELNPAPGEVLTYHPTAARWVNETAKINELAYVGNVNVRETSDPAITDQHNDVLKFDWGTLKWVSSKVSINELDHVNTTGATQNQILRYDTAFNVWYPGDMPEVLGDLTDTNIVNLVDNDMLAYNSSTLKWENVPQNYVTRLSELIDDVYLPAPSLTAGDVLTYDGVGKWISQAPAAAGATNFRQDLALVAGSNHFPTQSTLCTFNQGYSQDVTLYVTLDNLVHGDQLTINLMPTDTLGYGPGAKFYVLFADSTVPVGNHEATENSADHGLSLYLEPTGLDRHSWTIDIEKTVGSKLHLWINQTQ